MVRYSLETDCHNLINNWDKYPQYAYIRHNVKLIVVPIVNPWGFAHQERENIINGDD